MNSKSVELLVCKGLRLFVVVGFHSIQEGQYLAESCSSMFEVLDPWGLFRIRPCLAHTLDAVFDAAAEI